ncbi:MAG TPA: alpha/beta fold hydrolase, partial [Candidatus Acidoferrales bacterium]
MKMKRVQVFLIAMFFSGLLAAGISAAEASASVERREAEFTSGDVSLAGVLLIPAGQRNLPGVVIIHGSGASDRSNAWAAGFATGLAERGFAVLLPDKRGSGRSGGDWRTADFEALADDAIAGVKRLQQEETVDPRRVGVLGLSQGGHI